MISTNKLFDLNHFMLSYVSLTNFFSRGAENNEPPNKCE